MDAKHNDAATVENYCGGTYTADLHSGWTQGIGPRLKIGGRLYDHTPPANLDGERLNNWVWGYARGKTYRRNHMSKSMHFHARLAQGIFFKDVVIVRKSWSAKKDPVLAELQKLGCAGEVTIQYFEGSVLKRTVSSVV